MRGDACEKGDREGSTNHAPTMPPENNKSTGYPSHLWTLAKTPLFSIARSKSDSSPCPASCTLHLGPLAISLPFVPKAEELNVKDNLIGDDGALLIISKLGA